MNEHHHHSTAQQDAVKERDFLLHLVRSLRPLLNPGTFNDKVQSTPNSGKMRHLGLHTGKSSVDMEHRGSPKIGPQQQELCHPRNTIASPLKMLSGESTYVGLHSVVTSPKPNPDGRQAPPSSSPRRHHEELAEESRPSFMEGNETLLRLFHEAQALHDKATNGTSSKRGSAFDKTLHVPSTSTVPEQPPYHATSTAMGQHHADPTTREPASTRSTSAPRRHQPEHRDQPSYFKSTVASRSFQGQLKTEKPKQERPKRASVTAGEVLLPPPLLPYPSVYDSAPSPPPQTSRRAPEAPQPAPTTIPQPQPTNMVSATTISSTAAPIGTHYFNHYFPPPPLPMAPPMVPAAAPPSVEQQQYQPATTEPWKLFRTPPRDR